MGIHKIIATTLVAAEWKLLELDNQVRIMRTERFVAKTFESKHGALTVAWQNCDVQPVILYLICFGSCEHSPPSIIDFFDCTVIEFEQFALNGYNDVLCSCSLLSLLQFSQLSLEWFGLLDEWVLASEEALEDLVWVS